MMPKDGLSDTEMDTPQEMVPKDTLSDTEPATPQEMVPIDSLSDTETPLATRNGAERYSF